MLHGTQSIRPLSYYLIYIKRSLIHDDVLCLTVQRRLCCPSSDIGLSMYVLGGEVTGFLGNLKIRLCEERRLKDTQNQKWPSLEV